MLKKRHGEEQIDAIDSSLLMLSIYIVSFGLIAYLELENMLR